MVRLGARSCCRLARMCAHWDARPSSMRTTCVCVRGRYTTCGGYDYLESRRATKMKREVAEWLRRNSVYANVTKPLWMHAEQPSALHSGPMLPLTATCLSIRSLHRVVLHGLAFPGQARFAQYTVIFRNW